jgi:hypothetical protein
MLRQDHRIFVSKHRVPEMHLLDNASRVGKWRDRPENTALAASVGKGRQFRDAARTAILYNEPVEFAADIRASRRSLFAQSRWRKPFSGHGLWR